MTRIAPRTLQLFVSVLRLGCPPCHSTRRLTWWLPAALLLAGAAAGRGEGLQYPLSIAVSDSGEIALADRNLPGVWQLEGGRLELLFRASKRFRTPLNAVRCVEFDREGRLLVGDSATTEIYRFDDAGQPQPLTARPPAEPPPDEAAYNPGKIGIPMDIAVNSAGEIFVADLDIHRIVKVAKDGGEPQEVAQITGCRGLFVDAQDHLWVVSTTADQLHRIAPDGKQEVIVPGRVFEFPHTVVVDGNGTAYVCDGYAKAIWRIAPGGQPEKWVHGDPLVSPVGLAIQGETIYVADPRVPGIFKVDAQGQLTKLEFDEAEG